MRLQICAVGRLRAGPEQTLIQDYQTRFDRTGRPLGLGPLSIHEVEDKKGGGALAEAALLERQIPKGAARIAMDERGKTLTSPQFAQELADLRDQGVSDTCFVIGGADGLHTDLRAKADMAISFGTMVWPHMLARVMLVEQLYRAATILAGSPYHRV
jgi:23S rRNA (pseudouridine1915-N3)-methyltransferase